MLFCYVVLCACRLFIFRQRRLVVISLFRVDQKHISFHTISVRINNDLSASYVSSIPLFKYVSQTPLEFSFVLALKRFIR